MAKEKSLLTILKTAVRKGEIEDYNGYIIGDDEGWDDVERDILDGAFKRICEFGVDVRMVEVLMLQGMGITPQNIEEFARTGEVEEGHLSV